MVPFIKFIASQENGRKKNIIIKEDGRKEKNGIGIKDISLSKKYLATGTLKDALFLKGI